MEATTAIRRPVGFSAGCTPRGVHVSADGPAIPAGRSRPRAALRRSTSGAARLTARGRGVVAGAVLFGSLAAGMTLSQGSSIASGETPAGREYTYIVVQPGQTLWEIARSAAPGVDPRVTIERIRDLNALAGVDIRSGQRIALP